MCFQRHTAPQEPFKHNYDDYAQGLETLAPVLDDAVSAEAAAADGDAWACGLAPKSAAKCAPCILNLCKSYRFSTCCHMVLQENMHVSGTPCGLKIALAAITIVHWSVSCHQHLSALRVLSFSEAQQQSEFCASSRQYLLMIHVTMLAVTCMCQQMQGERLGSGAGAQPDRAINLSAK